MGKTSLLPARPRPSSRIRLVCASWLGDCSLPLKSSCVSSGATKRLCLRAVVQRSRSKTRCRRRAGTDSKPEPHVPRPPLFRRRQLSTLSLGAFPAMAGKGATGPVPKRSSRAHSPAAAPPAGQLGSPGPRQRHVIQRQGPGRGERAKPPAVAHHYCTHARVKEKARSGLISLLASAARLPGLRPPARAAKLSPPGLNLLPRGLT